MAGPVGVLYEAVITRLGDPSITAAGATGVYNKIAPASAALPFIIVQWQGGGDENDNPKRARNSLFTVQALAEVQDDADAIDAACDVLLHKQTLTVPGWTNFLTAREGDVDDQEVDELGRPIFHAGGTYRIRIAK